VFVTSAQAQRGGIQVVTAWTLEADAVHPGKSIKAALEVKLQENFHVHSNKPLDPLLIPTVLTVEPPAGLTLAGTAYPDAIMLTTKFSAEPLAVYEERFVLGALLRASPDLAPGAYTVPATLRYQACDDEKCFPPKTLKLEFTVNVVAAGAPVTKSASAIFEKLKFTGSAVPAPQTTPTPAVAPAAPPVTPPSSAAGPAENALALLDKFDVLATAPGFMAPEKFLAFIDRAETGKKEEGVFTNRGPLAILALVVLGGLALNLTPCVLPLVPINLAIIGAGAKAGSRGRGFALGGAYGLAMALVYGALGLVVILTSSAFGAINSTIWFNVAIAALFVVLGLAMFDVISIDFSKFQSRLHFLDTAKKGSFVLAFGMGAVSALLAGACVAPVVIQVIVYSGDQYARGNTLALGLPFFLGLGMALPWPFAGAGLSFLPKPGGWMVRVKQAMGLFILAFAAYYAYLAWEIFDNRRVNPAEVSGEVEQQLAEGGWTPSLAGGLTQALKDDKLVLVDMWASWCKNCLVMDKTTLKDPAVTARLEPYIKIKFQAEDLDASPAKEMLKRFDGYGLPQYAILKPKK
jgi:thiol:disulfide interchange protein